jgi:hypothetical protein
LRGSLGRFTVAIIEVTAAQMRGVLTAEGVFRNAATSELKTLEMLWRARQSPEYQDALHFVTVSRSAANKKLVEHVRRENLQPPQASWQG